MLKFALRAPIALMALLSFACTLTGQAAQVVFYVDGVTGGQPNRVGDIPVRDRLISLGHTVTTILDSAGAVTDTIGKDLIVISSSIQSGDMATYATSSLRTLALPILDIESALYGELLMGNDGTNPGALTSLNITSPSHPLAAGLSGTTAVYSAPNVMSVGATGTLGPDATVVATLTSGEPAIFTYAAGSRLSDNTTLAAARRIGFFLNETGVPSANADSFKLFDAAVAYALVPEPGCVSLLGTVSFFYLNRRRRNG
jgi:hypothetical protein